MIQTASNPVGSEETQCPQCPQCPVSQECPTSPECPVSQECPECQGEVGNQETGSCILMSSFCKPNLLEYGKSSPTALAQTSYFQKDSEPPSPPSPRLVTGISSHLYPVNLLTGPLLFLFLK